MTRSTITQRALLCAALLPLLLVMSGCWVPALIGGAVESYKESSTRTVRSEYIGLDGKTYAVVVSADRAIQAEHPELTAAMTDRINMRLHEHTQASGHIPSGTLLTYLLNRPEWTAIPLIELAEDLGVDRLIYVELYEYRLNEVGNSYLWDGLASGTVAVIETELGTSDFAFERQVQVGFPDGSGYGPMDISRQVVTSALLARFVDRSSWLFYDHEEPYYPDY
ncbi:MAG: hypothetical protein AAGB51_04200 [Planctomycetota bacterium]